MINRYVLGKNMVSMTALFSMLIVLMLSVLGCGEKKEVSTGKFKGLAGEVVDSFPQRQDFFDLSFIDKDNGWIVGYWGGVFRTKDGGKTFIRQLCGTNESLFGVYFLDAQNGWGVGDIGTVVYTTNGGEKWEKANIKTQYPLFKVQCLSPKEVWVVGAFGGVYHTTDGGLQWEERTVPVNETLGDPPTLYSLFFQDSNCGWVVGEFGTIFYTNNGGKDWIKQDTGGIEKTVFDIYVQDQNRAICVGMDGQILATEDGGNQWLPRDSGAKFSLFSVDGAGEKVWALGAKGQRVASRDRGVSWSPVTVPIVRAYLSGIQVIQDPRTSTIIAYGVGSQGTFCRLK